MRLVRREVEALVDGRLGYAMLPSRHDDCMRAALATVVQVHPREIPDPRLDERVRAGHDPDLVVEQTWSSFERWLGARGLRMERHEDELPDWSSCWIGVCAAPEDLDDHEAYETLLGSGHASRATRRQLRRTGLDERAAGGTRVFAEHCLVMGFDRVLFDPGWTVPAPAGYAVRRWDPEDITWGITIERKEAVDDDDR